MNVGQLKSLINNIPDDVHVVIPSHDHSYSVASAGATKALRESRTRLSEYHGPEYVKNGMTVIDVLVIS